jgi:hypothetical protein
MWLSYHEKVKIKVHPPIINVLLRQTLEVFRAIEFHLTRISMLTFTRKGFFNLKIECFTKYNEITRFSILYEMSSAQRRQDASSVTSNSSPNVGNHLSPGHVSSGPPVEVDWDFA